MLLGVLSEEKWVFDCREFKGKIKGEMKREEVMIFLKSFDIKSRENLKGVVGL